MSRLPPTGLLLALAIVGGMFLAGATLFASGRGYLVSWSFQYALTLWLAVVIVGWALLAWGARRALVGPLPKERLNLWPALVVGGSRISFLLAALFVLLGWLVSLALGLPLKTRFFGALVDLLVIGAFLGIAGGALLNSILMLQEWRVRTSR